MAEVALREDYKREDIAHMLHGATVPSEFVKSGNKIYVQGYGVKLVDIDGKEYIDGMSSGFCACLGYRNEELVETAREQMRKLHCAMSFYGRSSTPEIDLARKLSEIAPDGIRRFVFANSGSDANETAIKIVRWYWRQQGKDKYKIICQDKAYHGATYGAMGATSFAPLSHDDFGPFAPGFVKIPNFFCYRCPYGKSYPHCSIDCAQGLEEAIEREGEDTVGAFLTEPVLTSAGTIVPPPEYWPKAMEICKKHHVLLMIDEYITGFGRMGKLWASEYWSIEPDTIMFAKGLGSGYMPIAAVGIREEIYQGMMKNDKPFPHVFTYGGHPVSCAVALKNIEIMLRDNLIEKAQETGGYIRDRLSALQKQSPYVGDLRGSGLYFTLDLVANKETKEPFTPAKKINLGIKARMAEKGIIIGSLGPNDIALAPPLIITRTELDHILDALEQEIRDIKP